MAALWFLAALALGPLMADTSGPGVTPPYTADSITNTAANLTNYFAPNTFVTITGQNLAYTTRPITTADIHGATLPTVLIGTGLVALFNLTPADIYYVSPTQITLLIPGNLSPGPWTLQLLLNGLYDGPAVGITLNAAAPALFSNSDGTAIAEHLDGSLITPAAPAQAGEVVVFYASGLGATNPPAVEDQIPQEAAPLADMSHFQVLLNGVAVDPARIYYAGVTPTFAGLFQINVRLPSDVGQNPAVQISVGDFASPSGPWLPVH